MGHGDSVAVSWMVIAATCLAGVAPGAPAGNCEQQWDSAPGQPGMSTEVMALAVFDDGTGPAVYAGGTFFSAGGQVVNSVARWDGEQWTGLGAGVDNGISALVVFYDGTGPALYAGGGFTVAGGQTANRIARWDGSQWSPLGSGLNNSVIALTVFDDGTGPALYVGGAFTMAGGQPASRIARWDGAIWSPLGSGLDDDVRSLTVFDDGSGPALYAGGRFTNAGGAPAERIARWDGRAWSPLGSGVDSGYVSALAAFDDGAGSALYAGGSFSNAGGQPAHRIARWDGAAWSPLGSGTSAPVFALAGFDDNTAGGPALYAGGYFASAGGLEVNRIARWDGAQWSTVGAGVGGFVEALTVFDDGAEPALFVGGQFTTAGELPANRIAAWRRCAAPPCAFADLDCDGAVGTTDLLILLAAWGDCPGPDCPADLDGDALVGTADLLALLNAWG